MSPPHELLALLRDSLRVLFDLAQHPLLAAEIALIAGIVFFRLGAGMGIPHLFWHERKRKQIIAGAAATLLVGELLFISYLLHDASERDALGSDLRYIESGWLGISCVIVVVAAAFRLTLFLRKERPTSLNTSAWPMLVGLLIGLVGTFGAARLGAMGAALIIEKKALVVPFVAALGREGESAALDLHIRAGLFLVALLSVYATGVVLHLRYKRAALARAKTSKDTLASRSRRESYVTPALGICAALASIAAVQGYFLFQIQQDFSAWAKIAWLPTLVFFLALSWLAGRTRYRLRFAALEGRYDAPLVLSKRTYVSAPAGLKTNDIQWGSKSGPKKPLVLVCASGGGIRAAVWTTTVLCRLEALFAKELGVDFPAHVRIIAGASGGMVGAAYYVATLGPTRPVPRPLRVLRGLVEDVAKDSLTVVADAMIFHDLPGAFVPRARRWDRGAALESAWQENMKELALTFGELRERERTGELPSLVFSPMLVEDGRRLIVSNLDLEFLNINIGSRVGRRIMQWYSRSGYSFGRLFPEEFAKLPISTAARMSATFPYVTPAVALPTEPPLRVVDAGYYDNYGVNVVAGWLEEHLKDEKKRRWLEERVSGILVLQIRDGINSLSVEGARGRTERGAVALARGLSEVTTPFEGLLSAREAVMLFRNDEQLETMSRLYNGVFKARGDAFLTTAAFCFGGQAPLSWCLTDQEKEELTAELDAPANQREAKALLAWWRAYSPSSSAARESAPLPSKATARREEVSEEVTEEA